MHTLGMKEAEKKFYRGHKKQKSKVIHLVIDYETLSKITRYSCNKYEIFQK